jgi:hypothetical protein
MTVSKSTSALPVETASLFSWQETLLAVLPGVAAVLGGFTSLDNPLTLIVLAVMASLLITLYRRNKHHLPDWTLMYAGMLAAALVSAGFFLLLNAILLAYHGSVDPLVDFLVLLTPWVLIAILLLFHGRRPGLPAGAWLVLFLIVFCHLVLLLIVSVVISASANPFQQWIGLSLYSAGGLLLPLALGWRFLKGHGASAVLFAAGAVYLWQQTLAIPTVRMAASMTDPIGNFVYQAILPLFSLVIGPLWYLSAHSRAGRWGGLLVSWAAGLVLFTTVTGLVRGDFSVSVWVNRVPYIISLLLCPVFLALATRTEAGQG